MHDGVTNQGPYVLIWGPPRIRVSVVLRWLQVVLSEALGSIQCWIQRVLYDTTVQDMEALIKSALTDDEIAGRLSRTKIAILGNRTPEIPLLVRS